MTKIISSNLWGQFKRQKQYKGLVQFYSEELWLGGIVSIKEQFDKYVLEYEPLLPLYQNRTRAIALSKSMIRKIGNSDMWVCFTDHNGLPSQYNSDLKIASETNATLQETLNIKNGLVASKNAELLNSQFNKKAEMIEQFSLLGKAKEAGQLERLVMFDPLTGNMKPIDKAMNQ